MDETVLKIALAGFLHDIGKFADKECLDISQEYINNNADLYQPHFKGQYSHQHAVFTAAFIEKIEKDLPAQFNQANWGMEDAFVNLAAGHHNPGTPMRWIIAMADRISSGWDRKTFEEDYNLAVPWHNYKQTRLLPLFEGLMKAPKNADDYAWCYPLKALSPESIFPGSVSNTKPNDNATAASEYQALFEEFLSSLKGLLHKEENLELWFEHFDSLFMIYLSSIPAARAGKIIPDVSLYDHSKITAALSVALYLYHMNRNTMTIDAIRDYDADKFLIIGGDFYGIQDFIFSESGEAGKGRAKILRGRSFAVSLLSELAADMLCREMGIPSCCMLLNAAGKFTLIAPNNEDVKNIINNVEKQINDWLMKISFGENAIGITTLEASPGDFTNGRFLGLWDELNKKMDARKYKKIDLDKYAGTVDGYLDKFNNTLNPPLCHFCRKRPSSINMKKFYSEEEEKAICNICHDHIWLGGQLVKNNRIAITTVDADIKGNKLFEPIFGYYQVAFVDGGMKEMARSGKLLKYWDISISPEGKLARDVTSKFINGYVPVYNAEDLDDERILEGNRSDRRKEELIEAINEGAPKSFGHLASKAKNKKINTEGYCGIEALGILKADVDNLGLLMSCGLKEEQFTISRIATLSRQLNFYFAVYLPWLLKTEKSFNDIYTVFAGGDDLFLIGPWNRIIDLANQLNKTFADYVCHNEKIHFSAGISIHKPDTPVRFIAESAESELELSKGIEGKNCITIFSETIKWEKIKEINNVKEEILNWLQSGWINQAMLYRLNKIMAMAEFEKLISKSKGVHLKDMECTKWRAMLAYSVVRNVGKELKTEQRQDVVNYVEANLIKWLM
jgi:CRISPR-associated protein Csm1